MILETTGRPMPVTRVQQLLRQIFRDCPLSADGLYGPATREAVERFQRAKGLPITGLTGPETWEALEAEALCRSRQQKRAAALEPILGPYEILEAGSQNIHLYLVQALLRALGEFYPGIPVPEVSGTLDGPTARALRWFQGAAGLPQTGTLDRETWRHLARHYRLAAGNGSGSYPARTTGEASV